MKAVRESISFEKRSINLRIAKPDEALGKLLEFFLDVCGLGFGFKRTVKELDE